MPLLNFFEWFRRALLTPLKDHKLLPYPDIPGDRSLGSEGRLCHFKATKFCAMKEVNFLKQVVVFF